VIRSKRLPSVCLGIACWAASSAALAQGNQQTGLQRFVAAHAATMARYCSDAVTAGELVTLAFVNGYATAIKVGTRVVSWLSCRKALPAATRWADGRGAAFEPVVQPEPGQQDYLAAAPEPEQLPVEIDRVPVSPQEGARINALPAMTVRPLGDYVALMRQIDPNWVPPTSPSPPGSWRIGIIPAQ